jgi:hypothetical protein
MVNVCTRLNQQFQCLGITLIRRMKQWSPALRINAIVGSENSDPFHSGNSEPSGNSRKG